MNRQRVRLIDVAEAADVSRATASRVLSGSPRNVDPVLAERVWAVARRIGYRPHLSARALRTGQTGTVGIVVPTLTNPYFVALAEAFAGESRDRGADLLIADSRNDVESEAAHLRRLTDGRVDAIAIVPVSYEDSGAALVEARDAVPLAQVDRRTRDGNTAAIVLDNITGVRLLIEHLREAGRERIAYVGAETASSSGAERLAAFTDIAGEHAPVTVVSEFSTSAGREAARHLLDSTTDIDAIVCGADVLAVGVHSTLQRSGVSLPGDIALVSFDDSELLELTDPPITSLSPPVGEIARRTTELLMGEGDAWREPSVERLVPGLVIRESTQGHR
ncbi:LacI family DNA-binding transcriptional regulator [Aeromicrobium sp. YIM 150415]|uniref:LacI family DNA-binding transcriptional regulator n=1 Tax=Aeromicrobium sp. YIM 150415 TaxID=2803912 RepID=UPI00196694D4|nr:LacI family DNA-binding transcriptional regulator [Aeromicrobium sp. YIM 150415]MBM9463949.1 LacI family DNA-binding transcriptional regulator [Aeromicrobium sp. YIM 150415]